MAKMRLPQLKTVTYTPPVQPGADVGPAFVTPAQEDAATIAEDLTRDRSVEAAPGDVEGMTKEVVTSAEQLAQVEAEAQRAKQDKGAQAYNNVPTAPPVDDMPRWGTPPLAPRLAADDIAKFEEMSRTLLEVRGIAVAAQAKVNEIPDRMSHAVPAIQNSIVEFFSKRLNGIETSVADEHKYALELADEVAMLRSRLDAVDTLLASKGLPTTASTATKPVLKLHQKRRLVHAAKLDGDAVVLYYNPRQGFDGNDPQEFTLSRDNTRNVWCGYAVEVPADYVCDVFVDTDVVCTRRGKDEGEFILKMVTRGVNRTMASGSEVCRLTLRKVEAVRIEIVQPG